MNLEKIKQWLKNGAEDGVISYVLQDPVSKKPSVTYTLFYLNGIIALGGLVGRFADLVKGVDADAAKELLIVTGSLYLGRTLVRGVSNPSNDETNKETKEKTE